MSRVLSRSVIGILGFSGRGKTALVEKLVRQLSNDACSVTFVKHTHHAEGDLAAGGDTERAISAGAIEAWLVGHHFVRHFDGIDSVDRSTLTIDSIIRASKGSFILIEGFKNGATWPCIAVIDDPVELLQMSSPVVGVVSEALIPGLPSFRPSDVEGIARFALTIGR